MSLQEFEQLLATPFFAIVAIGAAISSLIPSAVLKWLMSAIYNRKVSFWLLLFVHVLHAMIIIAGLAYLGLLDPALAETAPIGPMALLSLASTALKLIMLTLLVADENGDMIAMWRWLIVEIVEFMIYLLIGLLYALLQMALKGGLPALPT